MIKIKRAKNYKGTCNECGANGNLQFFKVKTERWKNGKLKKTLSVHICRRCLHNLQIRAERLFNGEEIK